MVPHLTLMRVDRKRDRVVAITVREGLEQSFVGAGREMADYSLWYLFVGDAHHLAIPAYRSDGVTDDDPEFERVGREPVGGSGSA